MRSALAEEMGKSSLQIILDSPTIVLNQQDGERQKARVSGHVALHVRHGLSINAVKITFEGLRKVAWLTDSMTPAYVHQRERVILLQQTLFETSKTRLPGTRFKSGTYQWPFSFLLDANALPETIERLPASYVKYNVSATAYTGILSKDQHCKEHIRVIKTPPLPGPDLNFLPQQIHQDVWAEKLSYTISLHNPYTYIGSAIPIDFRLTPLQRGLQIGKIRLELVEEVLLMTFKNGERWHSHSARRSVLKTTTNAEPNVVEKRRSAAVREIGDEHVQSTDEDTADEEACSTNAPVVLEDEALSFRVELPVPSTPFITVQDIDSERIKSRHLLYITVELINADKHSSEMTMKFRPKLFLPPPSVTHASSSSPSLLCGSDLWDQITPPSYGQHVFDCLWSDSLIDEPPPPPPPDLVEVN
ncbi:uncharacterized protein J3D65DRAFT_222805 [Phyllosticta citribraziliensis]|uniref:Arrestin C-terminal-like domain-containing protein n=1 Tax=Phyllosticta citribraziliensis TaxID=989973 RepID=A0ABR1M6Q7_9PEZI